MSEVLRKINWTALGLMVTLALSGANAIWAVSAFASRTDDGVAQMKTQLVGLEVIVKDHATRVSVIENHIFYIRESLQRIERAVSERK